MPSIILCEGKSGTGKSTSLENIPSKNTILFTPNGKPLPFKGSKKMYVEGKNQFTTSSLTKLTEFLKLLPTTRPSAEYVIIDDFTHFFNARMMDAAFIAQNSGGAAFAKWNVFAADVFAVIKEAVESLPDTVKAVIILHHTQINEDGVHSFRSSGKLLENTIDVVSYFTYVVHSIVRPTEEGNVDYLFITNTDGIYEAKTPKGCFNEKFIPNDMKFVIDTIKAYENDEIIEIVENNENNETVEA